MKILVVNGPNLDLLGKREPGVYGRQPLGEILDALRVRARELGAEVECFQSNEEGELVTRIGHSADSFDGIIINPAGYTHTSVALRDAISACGLPCVEVHLSNLYGREGFRRQSLTAAVCAGVISGLGGRGYMLALEALVGMLQQDGGSR